MTRFVRLPSSKDSWDDDIPEGDEEAYHATANPFDEAARVERMRAENARKLQADFEKAMAPDYTREGRFQTHNCYACDHGKKPCVGEKPVCQYMRARND